MNYKLVLLEVVMEKKDVLRRYGKRLKIKTQSIEEYRECDNAEIQNAMPIFESEKEEYQIIVDTIKESMSREKGCYYCQGAYEEWRKGWSVSIPSSVCEDEEVVIINFCPMCGRDLRT